MFGRPASRRPIALTVDVSGSMSAEDVKPTRLGAAQEAIRRFLDEAPEEVPRRARHILVRAVRRRAADARSRARARRASVQHRIGPGHRDRRCAGPLGRARFSPWRRATTARPARVPAPAPADPDAPLSAILLLSDGAQTRGTLSPLRGRPAGEVVRHPRVRGRARHPERRHPAGRLQPARAAGPRHATADRGDDRRRVLRDPERGAPQRRLRGPRVSARTEAGMARAELRPGRARRIVRPRCRSALRSSGSSACHEASRAARRGGGTRAGCSRVRHGLDRRARRRSKHETQATPSPAPTPSPPKRQRRRRRRARTSRRRQREDGRVRRQRGRGVGRRDRPPRRDRHEQPRRPGSPNR